VRFGIQLRMLLVTFALGSLFVLYVGYSTAKQAGRDRESVREQMRLTAALAASRLDDHIGDIRQFMNGLSAALGTSVAATANNDAILRSTVAQMPANTLAVQLWDLDGLSIGSSEQLPPGPRPNAEEKDFFLAALNADGLVTQAPLRLHKGDPWTAVFALPIKRGDRVMAVISATRRLDTLPQAISPAEDLPPGAVISIVDDDGLFVGRSLDPDRWIGRPAPIDRELMARRLMESRGSLESSGVDSVARIFGIARSRAVPWLVYVGIPLETALAPARARTREDVYLGLAMLAIGLLIAWQVARRISRPLRELSADAELIGEGRFEHRSQVRTGSEIGVLIAWQVARRISRPLRELSADAELIGEGRFEHRSQVRTGSEIGVLAGVLNRMAEALQQRIAALRRSEERLSLALEGSEQSLFDWDIATGRIHFSARAAAMRGGPAEEQERTAEEMRAYVHPGDLDEMRRRTKAALCGDTATYEVEFRVRTLSGGWVWLRSRGRVVERDAAGRALRLVGTDVDITRQRAAEDELRQRAEFDTLTGLPNRALFSDRITGAMARAARSGHGLALLFIDVDHFKTVNDTHGHAAGDEVLRVVAQRLRGAVRDADTVARLAGDEFTLILEGLAAQEEARAVAAKVVAVLRPPLMFEGTSISVSVSVGVAFLSDTDREPADLLRRADDALYEAKHRGRNGYVMETKAAALG